MLQAFMSRRGAAVTDTHKALSHHPTATQGHLSPPCLGAAGSKVCVSQGDPCACPWMPSRAAQVTGTLSCWLLLVSPPSPAPCPLLTPSQGRELCQAAQQLLQHTSPPTSQHLHIFCPQILVKGSLFIACIDHRVFVKGLLCIASDSWGHQKSCGGKERQEEGGNPDNTD